MLSAIDRNTVRLQSESVAAFVGIRSMADGRPYPSGTAYEVLTAIEARKTAGKIARVKLNGD
jgi:hypothetical protein